jgi:hypothetical protein
MSPIEQGLILTPLVLFLAALVMSVVRRKLRLRQSLAPRGYWGRI